MAVLRHRQGWGLVALAALGAAGCEGQRRRQCTAHEDCEGGWVCVEGSCVEACNGHDDCVPDHACRAGVCLRVEQPACAADADCPAPGPCGIDGVPAVCRAGECRYAWRQGGEPCDDGDLCTLNDACDEQGRCIGAPELCTAPPPNSCNAADDLFTAYRAAGTCNRENGICDYAATTLACPSCRSLCLQLCAGVVCDDLHGGCRLTGRCDPTAPSLCVYDDAPENAPCLLAGDVSSNPTGSCHLGVCAECRSDGDCTSPPSPDPECWSGGCVADLCVYTPAPGVLCEPARCADGVLTETALCAPDGSCPPGATTSCGGFACTADGTGCRTAPCIGDQDCAPAYFCGTSSSCEPR